MHKTASVHSVDKKTEIIVSQVTNCCKTFRGPDKPVKPIEGQKSCARDTLTREISTIMNTRLLTATAMCKCKCANTESIALGAFSTPPQRHAPGAPRPGLWVRIHLQGHLDIEPFLSLVFTTTDAKKMSESGFSGAITDFRATYFIVC